MMAITLALTAKEWSVYDAERRRLRINEQGRVWLGRSRDGTDLVIEDRHATAALCLRDQPFGFTREMAEAIRACAARASMVDDPLASIGADEDAALANEAAKRIEALLPPEEP